MFFSSITADYTKMGYPKAIVRALDFLKNTDLKALPGGRHAIEGDMMYANVDDVETKLFETTKPESLSVSYGQTFVSETVEEATPAQEKAGQLPQTGSAEEWMGFYGLGTLFLSSLLFWKKKKEEI